MSSSTEAAESAFSVPPGPLLAEAVEGLAHRQVEQDLRAQAHALAALLRAVPPAVVTGEGSAPRRRELAAAVEEALQGEDESEILTTARELARHDASSIPAIDWTAVSGG